MFEGYVDQTTISQQIIETNLLSESLTAYNEELKARVVDGKVYELSNHLGNVLSVVSDRKFARDEDGDGTIDHYQPEILLSQDYSPFGVLLYERVFDEYQPSAANNCSAQNTLVNEVTVNDIFDTNVEYWVPRGSTQLSTITWDAGRMKVSSPSRYLAIDRWFETVVGETYTVTYDGDNGNLPFVYVRVIDMAGNNIAGSSFNAAGQYTFTFTATSTTTRLAFSVPNVLSGAPFIYYIDNVTIEGNQIQYACPEVDVFMDDFTGGMPSGQANVTSDWHPYNSNSSPYENNNRMEVKPPARYAAVEKNFTTVSGEEYFLEFDFDVGDFDRVSCNIVNGPSNSVFFTIPVSNGHYKFKFTAQSAETRIRFSIPDLFSGDRYFYLDNVKVYGFDEETIASEGVKTRYRYGFNGMERDDEVSGGGNSYTTMFRQYDPRLGRWLSIDPLGALRPFESVYAGFGNNPIYYVDPSGLTPTNNGGDDDTETKKMRTVKVTGKDKTKGWMKGVLRWAGDALKEAAQNAYVSAYLSVV